MTATTVQIRLPKPHSPGQQEILDHTGHGVIFAGRRYGKTEIATIKLMTAALRDPGLYWWVGLSWRSASMKRAWRLLKRYVSRAWRALGERPDNYIKESDKELRLPGGGEIWLRTAERPDSLAGEGIRGCVLDEFSLMAETVWTEYISATLLDYGGWALFVGVPKGRNWAFHLWQAAQSRPNWKAWRFTSYDNPKLRKEAIDELVSTLPERLMRQEILAEIIDDSTAIFRNIRQLAISPGQPVPITGHRYNIGVDWGRSGDYTVMTVFDATTRQVAHLDRFTGLPFDVQLGRITTAIERWQPVTTVLELNSIGQPLFEQLQHRRLPGQLIGFTTNNSNKGQLVDALALTLEKREIELLNHPALVAELEAFECETLPSGLIRYAAPAGGHDDCVMSLLLAFGPTAHGAPPELRRRGWVR